MNDFFDPSFNRRSLRLAAFDYSQDGAYFITIVTQGRVCLFGAVIEGEMVLSDVGKMVSQLCYEMPQFFYNMEWGVCQIMPNHFHAIIELTNIVGATLCGCPGQTAPTDSQKDRRFTLGDVVGRYKSLTTRRYIEGVRYANWPRFTTRLWQRNYYEHVIRDEKDYQYIFDYVISNPKNWEKDSENPSN